jgi:hypothetical protein
MPNPSPAHQSRSDLLISLDLGYVWTAYLRADWAADTRCTAVKAVKSLS